MAKDAKGHGSNTKGMRLIKTHTLGKNTAKVYNNPDWEEKVVKFFRGDAYQSKADYHTDDVGDAHSTALHSLQRYSDEDAKNDLSSGTAKSAPAPVHGGAEGRSDGTVGRHGYNPASVQQAITSSRKPIGGKEASAIHRLLRGRG